MSTTSWGGVPSGTHRLVPIPGSARPDGRITPGHAVTNRTSLMIPRGTTISTWRQLGQQLGVVVDSSAWWLGDWLIFGQTAFPDRYRRAIEQTNLEYQTLRNYAWVARQFEVPRRRKCLSFQHHAEVASLDVPRQEKLLSQAERWSWSRNELRRQLRTMRSQPTIEPSTVQIRIQLAHAQQERWEEAARRSEQELLDWMVGVLERAAQT